MEEVRNMPMDLFRYNLVDETELFLLTPFLWWWNPLDGRIPVCPLETSWLQKLSPTESAGLCINETDEDAISNPYLSIFLYSVGRLIPNILATRLILPPHSSRIFLISSFSSASSIKPFLHFFACPTDGRIKIQIFMG